MILHAGPRSTTLRTLPAGFWLVGDINARYCPPKGWRQQPPPPLVGTTVQGCCSTHDCPPDNPLKTP